MAHDQVQPLNYCAHAIEDLRELASKLSSMAPVSSHVLLRLINMLQQSVKFILPNCCNLIDPDELKQAHLDLTRLPYPCVAFEAPWEKEDGIEWLGEFRQTVATKRIALCWEARPEYELLPGLNDFLNDFPGGGIFVVPIYWGPEYRQWTVAIGGAFLPYESTVQHGELDKGVSTASRIAHAATFEAGLVKKNAMQINAKTFYLLPELYERMLATTYGGDREKICAQSILDSRDEVLAVIQACSVINCANVTTAEINAPVALNKKRHEKGKQPFFSYKVLQLSEERKGSEKSGAGGNHSSPRMHLRRGHLRRLESKTVWVRPAMINAGTSAGVVLKDYAVQSTV